MADDEDLRLCSECIRESVLQQEVVRAGATGTCMSCGEVNRSIGIAALADRIRPVFERHYELSPDEPDDMESAMIRHGVGFPWFRDGDPPEYLIQEMAEIPEDAARAIVASLEERADFEMEFESRDGNPYGDEARYITRPFDETVVSGKWRLLEKQVHHRARFFNSSVSNYLAELFEGIIDHKATRATHAVRLIAAGRKVYRARVARTWTEVGEILGNLPAGMGSPPGRVAKAGRMNATGIGVFYGALQRNTCLAEVRAPVGAQVVMGTFSFLRPVRVLNLTALENLAVPKSWFDLNYEKAAEQSAFLRLLSRQFAAPVLPGDEDFEYLLPQVVCEYLSEVVRLDGVLYSSSQTGGKGTNLVLFPRAAVVELLPRGTETSLGTSFDEDQAPILEITTAPPEEANSPDKGVWGIDFDHMDTSTFSASDFEELEDLTLPKPSLKFIFDSVEVTEIRGVAYKQSRVPIPALRSERSPRRRQPPEF